MRKLFKGTNFTNGCDLCYKLLRSLDGRARLREIAADPFQRDLIDSVRLVRFGERAPEPRRPRPAPPRTPSCPCPALPRDPSCPCPAPPGPWPVFPCRWSTLPNQ